MSDETPVSKSVNLLAVALIVGMCLHAYATSGVVVKVEQVECVCDD